MTDIIYRTSQGVGVAVALWTRVREMLGSNLWWNSDYHEVSRYHNGKTVARNSVSSCDSRLVTQINNSNFELQSNEVTQKSHQRNVLQVDEWRGNYVICFTHPKLCDIRVRNSRLYSIAWVGDSDNEWERIWKGESVAWLANCPGIPEVRVRKAMKK
jgi:hypothetical protein